MSRRARRELVWWSKCEGPEPVISCARAARAVACPPPEVITVHSVRVGTHGWKGLLITSGVPAVAVYDKRADHMSARRCNPYKTHTGQAHSQLTICDESKCELINITGYNMSPNDEVGLGRSAIPTAVQQGEFVLCDAT